MMTENGTTLEGNAAKQRDARVVRRCPYCGKMLYEKLGRCNGMIQIKCQKCGKSVNMNLALRRARG